MAVIATTEKLPFPLAKPNADTFVTKTSEIGHNGQPLDEVLEGFDNISKQSTQYEEQTIIYETDGGVQVGKIDANGADFINLKRGGQQVARMSDLPTKDTSIGDTPSTTNVPTTKAVKDYVDMNGIGGFPISKDTSIASSEKMVFETDGGTAITEFEFAESLLENGDETIIGNNALTDVYLKIGAYGIKVKAIFDINGNPISNPVDSVDGYSIQASPCSPLLMSQGKAAIFKSWSFIGASYESGVVQYQTSGGVASQYADYVHSWPEIFCKLNGVECKYIYAIPGASMNIWCTGIAADGTQYTTSYANRGRGKFENDSSFADAFIVNISSNDFNPNRFNGQIGNPDDISTSSYEANAALNTHCGWLAAIICEIRKKQPRAFIFVATCRKGAGSAEAIEAEIATANKFDNVFVMDMHTYGIDWANNTIKQRYMIGSHPNMNGYVALAHSFNAYVHYIIQNNPTAFREAQFVGTDYHDITNS